MNKTLIIMVGIIVVLLMGCGEKCQLNTPPWNETQVAEFEEKKVETVPLLVIEF